MCYHFRPDPGWEKQTHLAEKSSEIESRKRRKALILQRLSLVSFSAGRAMKSEPKGSDFCFFCAIIGGFVLNKFMVPLSSNQIVTK